MTDETTVVAMLERAEGNESVGTAWIETALFTPEMPLKEVIAWAQRVSHAHDGKLRGRLMLRYADDQRRAQGEPHD